MAKLSGPDRIHAALKKLRNESTAKELEVIELVANVYEAVQEKKDQVVDKVKETANTIDDSVRSHPWRYMAGAAVLGALVGRLLCRRY